MADSHSSYPPTASDDFSFVQLNNITSTSMTPVRPSFLPKNARVGGMPAARFRVRRPTGFRTRSGGAFPPVSIIANSALEAPLPSIELVHDDSVAHHAVQPDWHDAGLLSPLSGQLHETPTTPILQTVSFDGDGWKTRRQREIGGSIARPISVCSNFSSSSQGSDASSSFASSDGGTTCTSPERGHGEPISSPISRNDKYCGFGPSFMAAGQTPDRGWATSLRSKTRWTRAMDDHLWTTYQFYLQDPTMTPVKVLPGNAPPLGVCHRVARRAKQTWNEPRLRTSASAARFSTPQPTDMHDSHMYERSAVSDNESPGNFSKVSSSSTNAVNELLSIFSKPSNNSSSSNKDNINGTGAAATWPKHNITRRRLRKLVKERAIIPTHYMRLIANRSPSPFASSSRSPASRRAATDEPRSDSNHAANKRQTSTGSPDMGTRSVRIALATATSETMQPDGPLARLQQDTPEPTPKSAGSEARLPFDFNAADMPPSSPPAPVPAPSSAVGQRLIKGQSMNLDVHIEPPPRLGSPFVPKPRNHTWAAPGRRQRARPELAASDFAPREPAAPERAERLAKAREMLRPMTSTGPRSLQSPIQLTNTFPYDRSLGSKRRAENSIEDIASPRHNSHRRPTLHEVFRPPSPELTNETSHGSAETRRVRLRGFSLNDATPQNRHTQHHPAFASLPENDDPFVDTAAAPNRNLHHTMPGVFLNAHAPRQLGSPFKLGRPSPRFRVRHLPHNSLDSYPPGLFGSLGGQLGDR